MSIGQDVHWIEFEGERYRVAPGERALDAMLRRGAPVTFSCRKGSCSSCVLQAISGDPGEAAVERLPAKLRDLGFFLPCCATAPYEVVAKRPDWSLCTHEAIVAGKEEVAPGVIRLLLEPVTEIVWHPGQVVSLANPDGIRRSYSIVSLPEDYFLELHIRIYPGGAVSSWVADRLTEGDVVSLQGPSGAFMYDSELAKGPLTLVGAGTGCGAVLGIARDALAQGHTAPIHLALGAREASGLWLASAAGTLAAEHANLTVTLAASREAFGVGPSRVADLAFEGDMTAHTVYLCGSPDMVEAARVNAVAHGVANAHVLADPFDPPEPYRPREREKLAALPPDPEMWAALEQGEKLTRLLTDFYNQVYDDPRLSPFFHRVTKARAIEKQYSFLRDIFLGTRDYFGERPFNAHHWMVISDELFTYREELFFTTARRHGLPEPLLRRWAAMHEMFRREIVKPAPRGQLFFGTERHLEGHSDEVLGLDGVCDGCGGEILSGETVRMHRRTGEIACTTCTDE